MTATGQVGLNLLLFEFGAVIVIKERLDIFFHTNGVQGVQSIMEALGPTVEIVRSVTYGRTPGYRIYKVCECN